jgi:aspartate/methionine/tyrosine aminotransferase
MTPDFYDLDQSGKIVFEVFEQKVNELGDSLKAIIINSPSNPTGTVQEIDTLKNIEALCESRGIWILSDEVYKDLIYERENYLIEGERVATVNSFSKTYAMCGLRVGYVYSTNVELIQKLVEMKTHTSMNTSIIGQAMALGAMQMKSLYIDQHLPIWHERRDSMVAGLEKLGLSVMKPEGAFYVLAKLPHATRALHDSFYNYHIITYDGAWFGAPDHLRFSYALDTARIEEGLARLEKFLANEYASY